MELLSGLHWSQTSGHLNQVNFQQFLDDLSEALGDTRGWRPIRAAGVWFLDDLSEALGDTVAVMQLDRAPAHRAKAIQWPENIIPLFQLPHSPELNSIERFWQHLKGTWKGENFPSLDDLKQRVDQALAQLSLEHVQSLTSFDFILDALLQTEFHRTA